MGKIFLCRGKQDCGSMKRGAIRGIMGDKIPFDPSIMTLPVNSNKKLQTCPAQIRL